MNTSPNESNNNNEEEPIFVMTLELENGKAEHIKIYADSDPNELAYAFCKDHDLDFSALEYLKVRINDLLQQYKESGDENQIEEVDDEHEGTEDNKNFVYQTNENDSLRYSGEKEENKEGNSNEQVEITDNNNQSEENNLDEDNHQEEEYEEEEENEENKEEEEKISLKEESNSLKERPMNEEEGTLQDKEELLSEKIEHKEEEVNSNVIDNDKLRREEEIHQLTENNQIDDDIEVQDETPKEEDLHNEQEDELNEDNKPHVDPELEKEEDLILFHCSVGKDRVGISTYFFLSILDICEEEKEADFLITNKILEKDTLKIIESLRKDIDSPLLDKTYKELFLVNEGYLNAIKEYISSTYGSFDNFRKEVLNISDEEVKKLKDMYLE